MVKEETSHNKHLILIASTYLKIRGKQLSHSLKNSRLMSLTIGLFLLGYLFGGFAVFKLALNYIENLPGLGPILSERLFYLLFFFIFMMLIFSNSIILYSSVYRSTEMQWINSLPLRAKTIFTWKFIETFIFSSWGFYVISTPLILAYGNIKNANFDYYLGSFFTTTVFVLIPASISAWAVVLTVRFFNRYWLIVICSLIAIGAFKIFHSLLNPASEFSDFNNGIASTVNQILKHSELSIHPLMPSTWMSNALTGWSKPFESNSILFCLLIISYSLVGILSITSFLSLIFLPSYYKSLKRRANASYQRKRKNEKHRLNHILPNQSIIHNAKEIIFGRANIALLRKDAKTLIRDPAQWIQITLVYGLLFLYVLNIRNMGYQYKSEFWSSLIALMNLGVCSLSLSTLTTRFVFPQFSLEGRRLWILAMSQISMKKIIVQKLISSCLITGLLTTLLIFISSSLLKMTALQTTTDSIVILMVTISLNSMALCLGTLFPNLKEENSAKIVSGFGGTLCLILSFIYIIIIMLFMSFPIVLDNSSFGSFQTQNTSAATKFSRIASILVSATVVIVSIRTALRKASRIKYLRIP